MSAPRRYALRLATTAAAASMLAAGFASTAQAVTTPTTAQAKAALPAAKLVPGSVKLAVPVVVATKANSVPCPTKPKAITIVGHAVGASYIGKDKSVFSPKFIDWGVVVIVFPSAAKANAAAAALAAAEKACPKTSTHLVKRTTQTWTRSLGTKYTVGTFKGYRSVDHMTVTDGTIAINVRTFQTYLVRGKVMLQLKEVAGATPTNGKLQDTWRKAMTTLMVKRLAALK